MINPFLVAHNPYHVNPLIVLGVESMAPLDQIEAEGRYVENCLASGLPLDGRASLALKPGDGQAAVSALADPVLRLVFDCMRSGLPAGEGEQS